MVTQCIICSTPLTGLQRKFCSNKCKGKYANNRNQNYAAQQKRGLSRKIHLIYLLGGKCEICGYNKNIAALEFHHKDPSAKKFGIDLRHCSNRSISTLLEESNKCNLLCSNCHAEIEHPDLLLDKKMVDPVGIEPTTRIL